MKHLKKKIYLVVFAGMLLTPSIFAKDKQTLSNSGQWLDKKAHIVWARCSIGQTWKANRCQGKAKTMTWREMQYQITLANKQKLLGETTWRLPTLKELAALRYCSKGWTRSRDPFMKGMVLPAKVKRQSGRLFQVPLYCKAGSRQPNINSTIFPNTGKETGFWTATEEKPNPELVWNVHFSGGFVYLSGKHSKAYARLVHDEKK